MTMRNLSSIDAAKIISDDVVIVSMDEMAVNRTRFWTGLGLAVSSCFFIGASFIVKKKALQKICQQGNVRAGSGGYGYLREWIWWAGLLSMGFGEALNFAAYALAPASLVTPLGAISVLVSAVLASKYLDESLNILGKIGCVLCILGSTIIVIHAPTEAEVDNLEQLGLMLTETGFITYLAFVFITSSILIFVLAPKFGNSHLLVYVLICSLIGSLSVMACKGLGLALRETFSGDGNQLSSGLFWLFLFGVIFTVTIQMNYLNKALDIFPTSLVTPVYYVFFTSFVLIASSVLYKEWSVMSAQDLLGSVCGFLTVIIAIFLLNGFSDFDINFETLTKHWSQTNNKSANKYTKLFGHDNNGEFQPLTSNPNSSHNGKRLVKKRKKKVRNVPSDDADTDLSGRSTDDERNRQFNSV